MGSVETEGEHGRFCTQQQLVINLLRKLIDEMDAFFVSTPPASALAMTRLLGQHHLSGVGDLSVYLR